MILHRQLVVWEGLGFYFFYFFGLLKKQMEQEMATHFNILAWEITWWEEPSGLQSTGLQSWTRLSN